MANEGTNNIGHPISIKISGVEIPVLSKVASRRWRNLPHINVLFRLLITELPVEV